MITPEKGKKIKWLIISSSLLLILLTFLLTTFYPRTDDATVITNVVGIAPRVSGPILNVVVSDNQFVKAGDLLFEIDPTPYQYSMEKALAEKEQNEDTLHRMEPLLSKSYASQEQIDKLRTVVKSSTAIFNIAKHDLDSCRVVAPFDGYVTNLNITKGAFAHAAGEVMTLVDARNWYVIANFRESTLRYIESGMKAKVYLMTKPNTKYTGTVVGIGHGVVPEEAAQLSGLPKIKRELNWVRLSQRFPVRIQLEISPDDRSLRIGTSAIVTITGRD
jgi:multidrug resistance efflux pump